MEQHAFDVLVVGAGTAGSAAAYRLAAAGWRVGLLDARPFAAAGARWVNGVPAWQFARAGVPRPEAPELRGIARPVLLPADARERLVLGELPAVLKVDMRLLVERLQGLARAAGVACFEGTQVRELILAGERPVGVRALRRSSPGHQDPLELRARLLVDASGLRAVLRREVPALARHTRAPGRSDLCLAAQEVRGIADRAGARAYLARHGAQAGQCLTFLGVAGGYSTLMINLDPERDEVEILAGALADGSVPSGAEIIRRLRAREPWIGAREFGGQGRIPLRRPYDRLAAPGIALVGNAACQVFPAHGSGIGVGMIAGQVLAEALAGHDDPGGLEATWAYQHRFQREVGGLLGAYDVFRRLSQDLSGDQVGRLIKTGLMSPTNALAGLLQQMPSPSPWEGLRMLGGALRAPRLAGRMVPEVARMQAVRALYGRYPARPSLRELRRWSRLAARLHRGAPDLRRA